MSSSPDHSSLADFTIPGRDLFARGNPASTEGSEDAWRLARTVVDFASLQLSRNGGPRDQHRIRDLVLFALVRRSIITTEAIVQLLAKGLEEPAHGLARTLLELELAVELVVRDTTDVMATRLAANGYKVARRHVTAQLQSEAFCQEVLKNEDDRRVRADLLAFVDKALQEPAFARILERLLKDRHWHGFPSTGAALKSIGKEADYLMTFGTASSSLHATNLTPDLTTTPDGRLSLRAFVQRDPAAIQPQLGHTLLKLTTILERWSTDRGVPDVSLDLPPCTLTLADGIVIAVSPQRALHHLLLARFAKVERNEM